MYWLMFHDVIDSSCQKSGFADEEYRLSVTAFEKFVSGLLDIPEVAYTFDDGGLSSYTIIAPILEKYGKRGFFFIPTAFINRDGFLSAEQLVDLRNRGHVIGCHSHSHPENMTLMTDKEIIEEWQVSSKILREILKEDVHYASIPNGYTSKKIYDAVMSSGIKCILTSKPSTRESKICSNDSICTVCGRFSVECDTKTDDFIEFISFRSAQIRALAKWNLLAIVKKMLGRNYETIKNKLFNK